MNSETPQEVRRDRMTFYPVVVMASIFCVSIFIVIAATFGDSTNPANKWVNRNANIILIVETVLLLVAIFGAMTVDRIRTLKRLAENQQPQSTLDEAQQENDEGVG